MIVNPSKRGTGYGKQMITLGLKFAFEIYGADSVSLGVFENNKQAYYCYKSVGFEENGVREEYNLCGETWIDIDLVIKKETYYAKEYFPSENKIEIFQSETGKTQIGEQK